MTAVAVGFVVYLLVILVVGVLAARRTKTLGDFLLAGRRLGPWVVAFSERASGESGWMLLGLTGLAYATGLGDPSGTKLEPASGRPSAGCWASPHRGSWWPGGCGARPSASAP